MEAWRRGGRRGGVEAWRRGVQKRGTGVADGYPPLIPVPCCPLYPVDSGSAVPPSLWQCGEGFGVGGV